MTTRAPTVPINAAHIPVLQGGESRVNVERDKETKTSRAKLNFETKIIEMDKEIWSSPKILLGISVK